MDALKITLTPQTAFGTPLVGDTLFGHLCWNIAEAYGVARLRDLLDGYTAGAPFLIASDAFPADYLPLPTLPSEYWEAGEETDRKKLKKKQWLSLEALKEPVRAWQKHAKSNNDIAADLITSHSQAHNTINRATHTTGTGAFAPYSSEQNWYSAGSAWQLYLLHDPARISHDELVRILANLGHSGYGRDASTGLGKYQITKTENSGELFTRTGNAAMTIAPCCPQGLGYDSAHSYYQTVTRFGRHGNVQATTGHPFKKPVLMAQSGAVFGGAHHDHPWIGQGIGGISTTLPATVHQGYAPAIALNLELERLKKADAFS